MSSIFTIEKLYAAYIKSIKRKNNQLSAVAFSYTLESNLFELLYALQNRTYEVSAFKCFVVSDPVIREVFCSQFKDRIVQHLLLTEIEPLFESTFIYNSFACRKNKGTHLAVKRLQKGIQSIEDSPRWINAQSFASARCKAFAGGKYHKTAHYLQMDISGFFMSIDKTLLFDIIKKRLNKAYTKYGHNEQWLSEVLWLCEKIISADPVKNHIKTGDTSLFGKVPPRKSLFANNREGKGLPIGNLSSQFFANVYLNELDQYVKRKLKCAYYFRYVDDIIVLHYDTTYLRKTKEEINNELQTVLMLQLNTAKTHIQCCEKGIDFLGYIIRKKYLLVRKRVVNNLKQKFWLFENCQSKNLNVLQKINPATRSYFGHFSHANAYKLKQKMINTLWEIKLSNQ